MTDQEVLNQIQHHVMEEPNNGNSFQTELWTIPEVINYLNDRIRRFIAETKITLERSTGLLTTVGVGQYDLNDIDENLVDIYRIAWVRSASSIASELQRIDKFVYDSLRPNWRTVNGTPQAYSTDTEPQTLVTIIPAPALGGGFLDVLYTSISTIVSNTGIEIPVPDDFAQCIKWGVLADMLKKDGPAHDMQRSLYCEIRFDEGVQLAKNMVGGF